MRHGVARTRGGQGGDLVNNPPRSFASPPGSMSEFAEEALVEVLPLSTESDSIFLSPSSTPTRSQGLLYNRGNMHSCATPPATAAGVNGGDDPPVMHKDEMSPSLLNSDLGVLLSSPPNLAERQLLPLHRRYPRKTKVARFLMRLSNVMTLPFVLILALTGVVVTAATWESMHNAVGLATSSRHRVIQTRLETKLDQQSRRTEWMSVSYSTIIEHMHTAMVVNSDTSVETLCSVLFQGDKVASIRAMYIYSITQRNMAMCSHGNEHTGDLKTMVAGVTINSIHQGMFAIDSDYEKLIPPQLVYPAVPGKENVTTDILQSYGTLYINPDLERYFKGELTAISPETFWRSRPGFHHVLPYTYPLRLYDTEADAMAGVQKGEAVADIEMDLSRLVTGADWLTTHGELRRGSWSTVQPAEASRSSSNDSAASSSGGNNKLRNDGMGVATPAFGEYLVDYTRVFILQTWGINETDDPAVVSNNWGQKSVHDANAWAGFFSPVPVYLRVSEMDDPVVRKVIHLIDLKALSNDHNTQEFQVVHFQRRMHVTAKRYLTSNYMPAVYVLISIDPESHQSVLTAFYVVVGVVAVLFLAAFWLFAEHCLSHPLRRIARALEESSHTGQRVILQGPKSTQMLRLCELETLGTIYNAAMKQIVRIDTFLPHNGAATRMFQQLTRTDTGEEKERDEEEKACAAAAPAQPRSTQSKEVPIEPPSAAPTGTGRGFTHSSQPFCTSDEHSPLRTVAKPRAPPADATRGDDGEASAKVNPLPPPPSRQCTMRRLDATVVTIHIHGAGMSCQLGPAAPAAAAAAATCGRDERRSAAPPPPLTSASVSGTPFRTTRMLEGFLQLVTEGGLQYEAAVPVFTPCYVQMVFCRHAAKAYERQKWTGRRRRTAVVIAVEEGGGNTDAAAGAAGAAAAAAATATTTTPRATRMRRGSNTFTKQLATLLEEQQVEARANDAADAASFVLSLHIAFNALARAEERELSGPRHHTFTDDEESGAATHLDLSTTIRGAASHTDLSCHSERADGTASPVTAPSAGAGHGGGSGSGSGSGGAPACMHAGLDSDCVHVGWYTSPNKKHQFCVMFGSNVFRDLSDVLIRIGAPLLITEATYQLVCHAYRAIPLEAIEVNLRPGEHYGVVLYELLPGCSTTAAWRSYLTCCCDAFACMLAGDYRSALTAFERTAGIDGIDVGLLPVEERQARLRPSTGRSPHRFSHYITGAWTSQLDRLMSVCVDRSLAHDTSPYIRVPSRPALGTTVNEHWRGTATGASMPSPPRATGWDDSIPFSASTLDQSMSLRQMGRRHFGLHPVEEEEEEDSDVAAKKSLPAVSSSSSDANGAQDSTPGPALLLTDSGGGTWVAAGGGNKEGPPATSRMTVTLVMNPDTGSLAVARSFPLRGAMQSTPAQLENLCTILFPPDLGSDHTIAFLGHHHHQQRRQGHCTDALGSAVGCVMELYPGGTLREMLRTYGRALPVGATRRVVSSLFAGLSHLHARGVVHGDVRPENVLVGTEGRTKLKGFFGSRATAERVLVLSNGGAYASPEVAAGQIADAHSDVYGGGLVLLELLTGRSPWKWSTGDAGGADGSSGCSEERLALLLDAVASSAGGGSSLEDAVRVAMPPSGPVRAALLRVLLRCLEKDPARRPSAAEVVKWISDQPT